MRSCTIIPLIILIVSFIGCKKVIDVNLNDADAQFVITGEVNNQKGPYHVTISKSVNFSSDNIFPPVSGAVVIISVNGFADTLTETKPGDYITHSFTGIPGFSYQLYVGVEGHVFTAISTMPQPVYLDSITFLEGITGGLYPVANFKDPPGIANYYRFKEFENGEAFPNGRGNFVFEDRFSDGRYINLALYNDDSTDIKSGVKLTMEMSCVDESIYKYFDGLLEISSPGSPTPANPPTNISGGALGYFSANTKTSQSIEVP